MDGKKLLLGSIFLLAVTILISTGCKQKVSPTKILPLNTATYIKSTETPTAVRATSTQTVIPPTATIMNDKGFWTTRLEMATSRWEHNSCVVEGKIYVIGGAGPVYEALDTVEVYDPASDTWEIKSPMPTPRQALSTSVVNGKIYAIGGAKFSSAAFAFSEKFSSVEEYDPATDTWTTKSSMPTARAWHSANVVDGKIFIIGGAQGATPADGYVVTVEVYDPATDTWSLKGNISVSRGAGSGSVVDGKIYFFGGYGGGKRVDEYDPSTDTWTRRSDMPNTRIGLSASELDGKIYLIGGFGSAGYRGLTTVDIYDPATDNWITAPDMPTGRFGAYTGVVDGKIYVFGGLDNWPGSANRIVEVYQP